MRIALYHNLRPGGALRALRELVSRSVAVHEYDLYESTTAAAYRTATPMELQLESYFAHTYQLELPSPALRRVPLGYAHQLRRLRQLDAFDRMVADQINQRGYDLVLVHPCWARQTPSLVRHVTVPVVYYMQEPRRASSEYRFREHRRQMLMAPRNNSAALRAVDRRMLTTVDAIVARADSRLARTPGVYALCNSVHSQERILAQYGVQAQVSYLGVDDVVFAPSPKAVAGASLVVSVGPLDPIKGHGLVIEALGRLPVDSRPRLTIAWSGDDPSRYEIVLRERARSLGVDVDFDHNLNDEQLVELYRSATATICAAELEPFGLTALESLACGTPVVAIRQGGFRETVFDGATGYLAAPEPADLARAIAQALASADRFDPDVLHRWIGEHSWTWSDAVARLHGHLESALDRASAGRHQPE